MMQRKGKASGLLMMVLAVFSGCSQTEYKVGQTAQRRWRPIDNEQVMKARQAPSPRIAPETHFAAGVLLEQQGQPGQAVEQFRRAIVLNHNYAEAYHRLGVLLGMTGQHVEAEENLRKAVVLKPTQAFFHNDLGFELMQQKEWAQAEAEFREALELYPRMPRANINLALAVSQQGRFDEALACFRTALPEADAQFNLGLIYKTQQRYSEAADCFRQALEERPLFVAAGTQLAFCTQNMNGGQPTDSFTQTTQPYEPQPSAVTAQNNDSTIPVTTSNEPRPRTMAAQTTPEEPVPPYLTPTPVNTSNTAHELEWIEVQTSDGPISDDPITEPLFLEPEPLSAPVQPLPIPAPAEPQSFIRPKSTFEPVRSVPSRPEPMPITATYGYEPAPAPLRSQLAPMPRSQPASSSAQEVYVVPMSDVGGSQPAPAPPACSVTPTVQPTPQSNAAPAGYQDEPAPQGMTPEEFRIWRAERRAQAIWVEEQRTGQKVARTPTYFHESKYTTQIINEQSGANSDSRSTMAATVYETKLAPQQGLMPGEQPLDWLETVSQNNVQLQSALNNLRCESIYGPSELDFSPFDMQGGYPAMPMTIVPPESPAAPLEFAPAAPSRSTSPWQQSNARTSTIQPTGSGEAVVPMTDPNERSSRR